MFIYDTANFIFTKISAESYKRCTKSGGVGKGWGSGSAQKRYNSKFAILIAICQNNIL